jgi:hypothetical protein
VDMLVEIRDFQKWAILNLPTGKGKTGMTFTEIFLSFSLLLWVHV